MSRPRLAVLSGPTAVGKTAAALHLARVLVAAIVNADSLQVYRELYICTAKPTVAERQQVLHHLIDVVAPDEPYDAARYAGEARAVLADLAGEDTRPLVVGGTGLYIKALLHGLFVQAKDLGPARRRLLNELATGGLEPLYARLLTQDPLTAARLHPGDTYRILRALEVLEATGRSLSYWQERHRFQDTPYEVLKLGLILPREELYRRIETRVEVMLAQGWLSEVEELLSRYPSDLKPLQAIGYRHLIAYLKGAWSLEAAVALIKRDTRRYAKRQLTWFLAYPEMRWFHPAQVPEMLKLVSEFFAGRVL